MIELRVASLSDRGRVRELNEDSVLAEPPLVAVADGMGGHVAGEVASSLAVEVLHSWRDRLESTSSDELAQTLREAFAEVNRSVYEKGQEDASLTGMGTTLTACWIEGNEVTFAHVGDSRAYLLRDGTARQVTEDQTVAQEWVRRGRLTSDEAATSPQRHILLQALGPDADRLDIDTFTLTLQGGDRLLLATDGMSDMIPSNDRIAEILLAHPNTEDACRALVEEAIRAGGGDNVSVVLVDAVGEAAPGAAPLPEELAPTQNIGADGDGDTGELPAVHAPGGDSEPAEPKRRTGLLRRLLAVAALVLVALFVGLFLIRTPDAAYVVASRRDAVVLLEGRPGRGGEAARGDVIKAFEPRVSDFAAPVREALRSGYQVDSPGEAERLVQNLPRMLGPEEASTPTPAATASPSPVPATPGEPSPTSGTVSL